MVAVAVVVAVGVGVAVVVVVAVVVGVVVAVVVGVAVGVAVGVVVVVRVAVVVVVAVAVCLNIMEQLTPREVGDLRALEVRIEEGQQAFVVVAQALLEIRDRKLYRDTHSTFQNYCRTRWGFSGTHAYRFIEAACVIQDIKTSPIGDISVPTTESQCRPLTVVEPSQRAEVFSKAVQKAKSENKPVTARHVEAAVNEHIEKPAVVAHVVAEPKDSEELAELKQAWLLAGKEDREAFKTWANI